MGHVIIVGAGPAGASLASILAKRDIEVTLIERQRDFNREFRGELLLPSGINALETLGLKDQLAAVPSCSMQTVSWAMSGKVILERQISADKIGEQLPTAVSQPAMLEMRRQPGRHVAAAVAPRNLPQLPHRSACVQNVPPF